MKYLGQTTQDLDIVNKVYLNGFVVTGDDSQMTEGVDTEVTSVNGKTGAVTLTYSDVGAMSASVTIPTTTSQLTNNSGFITNAALSGYATENWVSEQLSGVGEDNVIEVIKVNGSALTPDANKAVNIVVPSEVTEATVSGWGFTKNTGTYSKPNGGIPKTDLSAAVQASLDLADSALQSYTETDPTVPSWAKASTKPSYTFSEIGSKPTTISGYGITNAYTKTEVDGLVAGVLHYKGTKATVAALPSSGNTTGDVWHVTADGSEWAWDGSTWQELGTAVDLSGYALSSSLPTKVSDLTNDSGFITSYTETDPIFSASVAAGITSSDITNWNGKTSNVGTITGVSVNGTSVATSGVANITSVPYSIISGKPTIPSKTSDLTNDSGFLTISTLPVYDESMEDV